MAKPTFVLVPGAWHTPEIYAQVIGSLEQDNYPCIGLALPSVGAMPAHTSFDQDVEAVRNCATQLVESEGKEVVLVLYSYSGTSVTEAPVGLSRKEREEKGLNGGVIRLVYIMAFAIPEGFRPTAGGAQYPDWMKMNLDNGTVTVDIEDAKRVFYNDVSSKEADVWAAKLLHKSVGVYISTTSYAAWRYIPSTFVIGKRDEMTFTPQMVDMMISIARSEQPTAFGTVEHCDAGHCLIISRPEWLVRTLKRAGAGACFQ